MITELISVLVIAFTVYMLVRLSKSGVSTAQDDSKNRIYKRMFIGGCVGFIIGFGVAILLNPPYKGIWETPNDVQGIIMASWVMGVGVGALLSFRWFVNGGAMQKIMI